MAFSKGETQPDSHSRALAFGATALLLLATTFATQHATSISAAADEGGFQDQSHSVRSLPLISEPAAGSTLSGATDSVHHMTWVAARTAVLSVDELSGATAMTAAGYDGYIQRVAVDPGAGRVYASLNDDWGRSSLLTIDMATRAVARPLPVPGGVSALTIDDRTHTVFTAGDGEGGTGRPGTVSFIDEQTSRITNTVAVGLDPEAIAVDQTAGLLYVVNEVSGTVTIIDIPTAAVIATIGVGDEPLGVTVDQSSHRAFVSNARSHSVSVIGSVRSPLGGASTFGIVSTITVSGTPWGIAADSVTHLVYVVGGNDLTATLIDGVADTVVEVIPSGVAAGTGQQIQVSVDETLHTAYVVSRSGAALDVVAPTIGMQQIDPRDARVGTRYSFDLGATAFPAATVNVTDGSLPDGVGLNNETGILSGVPTRAGSYTFTVTASNGVSPPCARVYLLRVSAACRLGWCG